MTHNSRILILDDEFLVLLDLMTELQQRGFSNIQTASNTAGAMAIVETGELDVAILDINLGSETSYPVASLLKSLNVPFAFVSGYGKEALEAEFDGTPVLAKPISGGEIDKFLRQALQGKRCSGAT